MTIQQAAQKALDVQDACNLSGVAHTFDKVVTAVFEESQRAGQGTNWRNTHPIVTMFLLKMSELNGCGSTLHESYDKAEAECKALASESVTVTE